MECVIHSPAFNHVKMAWVAGVGRADDADRVLRLVQAVELHHALHAERAARVVVGSRAVQREGLIDLESTESV